MADYCSSSDVKTQMPEDYIASSSDYDTQLGVLCTAASRLIDREVGYWPDFFSPSTDAETRYFDGNGDIEIDIDPVASLTSVAVSEAGNYSSSDYTSWTQNTDYYTWPYNASGLTEPIVRLIIDHNGSKYNWTRYKKAVQVVGRFGYSTSVPELIQQAATTQTMRWYMKAKQGWQDGSANPDMGMMVYAKRLDPDIKEMLWSFIEEHSL